MTAEKRVAAQELVETGLSIAHACSLIGLGLASYYRQPKDWREADSAVIEAINEVLAKVPRAGFWKGFTRMRSKGYRFNHKRVFRVYRRMGLNLPRRVKRKLPKRVPKPLVVEPAVNSQWALDFMHDTLYCGKRFRTLNVIDEGTREYLAIEVDTSLPVERVIRVLEQLKEQPGLPEQIRLDNGPELISDAFATWCEGNGIDLAYIEKGRPQQNGFAERFNGSMRREFSDAYLFDSLSQVREMAWVWRLDYNDERPHESLGNLPPSVYRQKLENSNLQLSH